MQIYGSHAVEAALENPDRTIFGLYLTDNAYQRLAPVVAKRKLKPYKVGPNDLSQKLGRDAVHQGALLETSPLPEPDLATILDGNITEETPETTIAAHGSGTAPIGAGTMGPSTLGPSPLLILDQVTDPHNVGAIIRSAAVFGAKALIMTRRNSPPLSGTLAKAASGGLEHVPIIHVTNLARTLEQIGLAGYDILGLEGTGAFALEDETGSRPKALVLGAEDKGLRRLTREACHRICRLSTAGPLKSLNVSNASAVALHTVRHLRPKH